MSRWPVAIALLVGLVAGIHLGGLQKTSSRQIVNKGLASSTEGFTEIRKSLAK